MMCSLRTQKSRHGLECYWIYNIIKEEMAPSCPGKLFVGRENLEAAWEKEFRWACGGNQCSAGLELV